MGFIKDWPVVVCIIDPQDDLSDGRETAFVLGRDVEDVGGQGLNLKLSEGEGIIKAIFKKKPIHQKKGGVASLYHDF